MRIFLANDEFLTKWTHRITRKIVGFLGAFEFLFFVRCHSSSFSPRWKEHIAIIHNSKTITVICSASINDFESRKMRIALIRGGRRCRRRWLLLLLARFFFSLVHSHRSRFKRRKRNKKKPIHSKTRKSYRMMYVFEVVRFVRSVWFCI